jgi:hypothetical protein
VCNAFQRIASISTFHLTPRVPSSLELLCAIADMEISHPILLHSRQRCGGAHTTFVDVSDYFLRIWACIGYFVHVFQSASLASDVFMCSNLASACTSSSRILSFSFPASVTERCCQGRYLLILTLSVIRLY